MAGIKKSLLKRWRSWILLNNSWTSRWWYSAVHITTVTVGTGVLGLPTVMAFFGWELGTILIVGFMILSQMCYWQLIGLHETQEGRRFDRYPELGQHLLGDSLGFWLIAPLQAIAQVGIDTVYVVAGANSLQHIYSLFHECNALDCGAMKLTYWMLVFMAVQLLLSQLPHLQSITWVSFIAAVTAIGYCTLTWVSILINHPPSPSPSPPSPSSSSACFANVEHGYPQGSKAHITFGIFTSLGKLAFAMAAAHNVALELQATIPSTRNRPSKRAMWRGMLIAYIVVAFCYLPVALVGYRFYGNETRDTCPGIDNVLLRLKSPKPMIVLTNLMLFIHLCGSYQVLAMPIFSNFETFLERKYELELSFMLRTIGRYSYVVLTLMLAAAFPFFGDLEAFFGGFALIPTTYVIPSVLWHLSRKPEPFSPPWIANLLCISFGIAVMATSTIGGLRNLIMKRRELEFFQ
ncbi:lysine histidine transporter 1-like isoform X2 [Selaginella moellendorffii]|uniref:lysine histidine transporter 1-like isoform X2 n=1 Tax=Selaginella moellendorffii TaxID=88036 RepID=UPI000D1CB0F5|nr:lysine histidine transporter 1-like isoform X2 [Selaginella moellendorffii]|eukprot:XP_024534288.1 lysine histidine transporter 1-like isoform X2 [Selaginella moellendorffii]